MFNYVGISSTFKLYTSTYKFNEGASTIAKLMEGDKFYWFYVVTNLFC